MIAFGQAYRAPYQAKPEAPVNIDEQRKTEVITEMSRGADEGTAGTLTELVEMSNRYAASRRNPEAKSGGRAAQDDDLLRLANKHAQGEGDNA